MKTVTKILDADIYGLKAQIPDEFSSCAGEFSVLFDVSVAAGGDEKFSRVINSIDMARTAVAFIPLGSGGSYGAPGRVLTGFKPNFRRPFQTGNLSIIDNRILFF